ncbi:single-stranded DNA-binding protein [Nocardioides zeae]|uniref:Single-stranded DNA-binding protein n=1 Tax=Nocardioides zeae TaxID=1457234 RepID=A0A6P0HKI8_9ACTN|nr:single-stranded DNA-binding protein [Nocardioides zeae]
MSTTHITVQGWVGTEVESSITSSGRTVATFRLGSTPSRQDRDGTWQPGETAWWTVRVWRQVAEQVGASLHKGEPVVVTGRLVLERWDRADGSIGERHIIEATALGHDLTKGRSAFMRAARPVTAPQGVPSVQHDAALADQARPMFSTVFPDTRPADARPLDPQEVAGGVGVPGAAGPTGEEPQAPAA